ncbi:DUF2310 family Zn-ribbon-containing protein [Desulfonema magnum]|uniref:DUF2310 n=1 Tax=Desulfonema magnum TaxID=45655 RepID=A0A975BFC5_9BACT|nr:DUF2310 family Zn-ribbon-containing protein [Desulfonema magnum]QTA84144.1 DUF2310 [Desulfonema magnum]
MKIAEIRIPFDKMYDEQRQSETVSEFVRGLSEHGCLVGDSVPIARTEGDFRIYTITPEADALSAENFGQQLQSLLSAFKEAGLGPLDTVVIGDDPGTIQCCSCGIRSFIILYTSFLDDEPPLRCGNCFKPVPLYRIPDSDPDLRAEISDWADDYRSCDRFWICSGVGEKFGYDQISKYDSPLSREGMKLSERLTSVFRPSYYYLYRYKTHSEKAEMARKCPICGGDWYLERRLHNKFDFKCDKCRLLSNIAFDLKPVARSENGYDD